MEWEGRCGRSRGIAEGIKKEYNKTPQSGLEMGGPAGSLSDMPVRLTRGEHERVREIQKERIRERWR